MMASKTTDIPAGMPPLIAESEPRYWQRWGLLPGIQAAIFRRLRQWLGLHVYGVHVRPIRPDRDTSLPPGFTYRIFEGKDLEAMLPYIKDPSLGISEDFVRTAFGKGDVCDAIFHDDEIVSYTWISFSPTHHSDGVFIEFRKGDRYGYKALTRSEYRGQHLRRRPQSDEYCHRRGCTHVIGFIDVINRSAIRASYARGNNRIGYAGYLKRGKVFFPFRSPAVRRRGFRFFIPQR
jgi:hypothetical protein